jgi:hypothetical protein
VFFFLFTFYSENFQNIKRCSVANRLIVSGPSWSFHRTFIDFHLIISRQIKEQSNCFTFCQFTKLNLKFIFNVFFVFLYVFSVSFSIFCLPFCLSLCLSLCLFLVRLSPSIYKLHYLLFHVLKIAKNNFWGEIMILKLHQEVCWLVKSNSNLKTVQDIPVSVEHNRYTIEVIGFRYRALSVFKTCTCVCVC